ncbi:hypothetical protein T484DRAFT_1769982 [Baffinella frigidus]|nr:hypothetical protein T484DRAFT_1769982 [Cryptophyta sp. CCMP2293]
MVSIQDKVAMMDLQKKIANRILIARKSEECEIVGFPIKTLPLELWTLHGLTLLWVNNCQLETLDPGIGNLERLQVIKLNNNNIRRIPEEIGHCRALLRLWCHNNKLDMLPRTIGRLEKLEHFSLEKNNLKMFPWEFGRLTSLTALSYDDNKVPTHQPSRRGQIDDF